MKRLLCGCVLLSSLCALAQARVGVHIDLPGIRFELPPPLVVVSPGVQVVEDYDDEVFFVDDWYWVRRGPTWYRARDHHGGWVLVERRFVPGTIVRLPPGHYKRWKPNKGGIVVKVKDKHRRKHHDKH